MNTAIMNIAPGVLTMSSLEIAELVGSEHDAVKLSIVRLGGRGLITLPPPAEVPNPRSGPKRITVYNIGKRDSYVVVAQLSPEFTADLVDRWQELEASAGPVLPKTMAQALRLAADQAEQIEAQQAQLEQQRPAVEFVEKYTTSTGNKGFREVCKLLGAKENAFREFLAAEMIMYRLAGELVPYAPHLAAGRFVVKTGTADHGESSHAFNQAKFTPKGVAWVAGEWAKFNLQKKP